MLAPQEIQAWLQRQMIESIKAGQTAMADRLLAGQKLTAAARRTPGYAQLPLTLRALLGDPAAVVDSIHDTAGRMIELNRHLCHEWLRVIHLSEPQAPRSAEDPAATTERPTSKTSYSRPQ